MERGKVMDKKPLIVVSVLAVVLLVLGSLSNVVGYQSVKQTVANDSPLFNIRTNKATNNENNRVITSDYLGKGLKALPFPLRDNRTALIQKVIERISTMDDATFTKFLQNAISWLIKQDKYKDVSVLQLIFSLYELKENPKAFERYLVNYNNDSTADEVFTADIWFPGCYLLEGIALILVMIFLSLFIIFVPTVLYSCDDPYGCTHPPH